jgi:hypothetical protein
MKILYDKYEIELKNDRFYSNKSSNNLINYQLEYYEGQINNARIYTINKRGVIIRDNYSGIEISSAILCENGGRTEISQDIYEIDNDKIWISVGDKMYCLNIPDLTINWFNRIDYGTTYSINNFGEDFIVHGDLGLIRIGKNGEIKWRFMGGRGIFIPGEGKLKFFDNHIELIDGNNDKFIINEFGEEIK